MPGTDAPGAGRELLQAAGSSGGVLPVDKPEGPTSHDVVAQTRRAFGIRRIGHTGTLDPFASGLLLLCLGPATRLAEYVTALPKTYRAVMRLGQTTDTDDLTGEILRRDDRWDALTDEQIRAALQAQAGEIEQLPPLFSAKKVAGERMYAAARRGEAPERSPVRVTVHRIELVAIELPDVKFDVECSSGTYIRAIARDVGEALGPGAHLRALRRTRVGEHSVESAISLDELSDAGALQRSLLPPIAAVSHLEQMVVTEAAEAVLRHGGAIPAPSGTPATGLVALASAAGELLAIGEADTAMIRPRKVFA